MENRLEDIDFLFISSLKENSTSISLLRSVKKLNFNSLTIISDIKNQEFKNIKKEKGFFDVSKYVNNKRTIVLFVEGGSMNLFPLNIHKSQSVNLWYGIDSHMNYNKHKFISRLFDISFIAQKEYALKLKNLDNITNCFWLPLAYDSNISNNYNSNKRKYDISYIGSMNRKMHSDRFKLIDQINKTKMKSFIGRLNYNEMYDLYRNSVTVFNRSVNNDLNMRFFEAIGSGALLLTNKIYKNGLDDIFEENIDYLTYDYKTFSDKLKYVKNNIERIEKNSKSRIEKILTRHTYDNRVMKILEIYFSNKIQRNNSVSTYDYLNVALSNASIFDYFKLLNTFLKNLENKSIKSKLLQFLISLILKLK